MHAPRDGGQERPGGNPCCAAVSLSDLSCGLHDEVRTRRAKSSGVAPRLDDEIHIIRRRNVAFAEEPRQGEAFRDLPA